MEPRNTTNPPENSPAIDAHSATIVGDCAFTGAGPQRFTARDSPLQRLIDWVFGYDFFISYKHADGANYPIKLANQLGTGRFTVFLDEMVYLAGDELNAATRRRVRMSTYLVFIARPGAMARSPWALQEVKECINARRTPIVVSVDCAFEKTQPEKPEEKERCSELRRLLGNYKRIFESSTARSGEVYDGDPAPSTITSIIASFKGLRQARKRRRVAISIILLLAGTLLGLLYLKTDAQTTQVAEEVFKANPINALASAELVTSNRLNWWIDHKIREKLQDACASTRRRSTIEPAQGTEAEDDDMLGGMTTAALVLINRGHEEDIWPYLSCADNPDHRLRSLLIHWLWTIRFPPESLQAKFVEFSANQDDYHNGIRQAILLALGKYPSSETAQRLKDDFLGMLESEYKTGSDPGVHSAIAWLATTWGATSRVRDWDKALQAADESDFLAAFGRGERTRRWFVTPFGLTMTVMPPGQYWVSSRALGHSAKIDSPHETTLSYWFAISTTEITNEQFERFSEYAARKSEKLEDRTTSADPWLKEGHMPATMVSWSSAMRFCDWLTDWPNPGKRTEIHFLKGQSWKPDPNKSPSRSFGYRLPTEIEWEIISRAGASTSRFCANVKDVLSDYAWTIDNSQTQNYSKEGEAHPHSVGLLMPNPLGLFDIYGNAEEWCIDTWTDEFPAKQAQWVYSEKDPIRAIRPTRGGACDSEMREITSLARNRVPAQSQKFVGFRVARTLPQTIRIK